MSDTTYRVIPEGITAPQGFCAAAVHCGIKPAALDLILIYSDRPAAAAATITTNSFRAAPTFVTEEHTADGRAQAIVANSGNANSVTGTPGLVNALEMGRLAGAALGVDDRDVVVCSTGLIGIPLPMDKIAAGIQQASQELGRDNPELIARGIMTTDTSPKMVSVAFDVDGTRVKLGGIAKGAGMICPDMATMLCFITTDLAIEPNLLKSSLGEAVGRSFNCISVDGCMSTNDTVAILANGAAGNPPLGSAQAQGYEAFAAALGYVTRELAKMIVRDGESASKFAEITVKGADSCEQARLVGRTIANYNLLKCSLYAEEINPGRLAAALGSSRVAFDPNRISLTLAGITVWEQGAAFTYDEAEARRLMQADEVSIDVDLGLGEAEATVWTCDLTPEYVTENAGPDTYECPGGQA